MVVRLIRPEALLNILYLHFHLVRLDYKLIVVIIIVAS